MKNITKIVMSHLRLLLVGFSPQRTGVNHKLDHTGLAVEKVVLGQVFSERLGFSSLSDQMSSYKTLRVCDRNVITNPAEQTKNDCVGEYQQQFTRLIGL
jgi:hypothetical protein